MEKIKDQYVYEWFVVETGEVFYVGTAHNIKRLKNKNDRNPIFKEYVKKYKTESRRVLENLTEKEGLDEEINLIAKYKSIGWAKANMTKGGETGPSLPGEMNPMFGKTHSKEVREYISKVNSDGRFKGKNNPMYGISPKERMGSEKYYVWLQKQRAIDKSGENNPNYGNRKLSKIYSEDKLLAKEKQGRPGLKNGRCVPVSMYDEDMKLLKTFPALFLCAEYLKSIGLTRSSIECIAGGIRVSNKKKKTYLGHYFEY